MKAIHLAITLALAILLSLYCFPSIFRNKNASTDAPAAATPPPVPGEYEYRGFALQNAPGQYDYCDFAIQWCVTACMLETCKAGAEYHAFSIHGFWPENITNDGSKEIINCPGKSYDSKLITGDLLQNMENLWPSLTGANDGFWKKEWIKHGTCFDKGDQTFLMVDYFTTGVNLGNPYATIMWEYLRKGGIKAGEGYDESVIRKAISQGSASKIKESDVQVQCVTTPKGQKVVTQIFLCFDKPGRNPTACPPKRSMCYGKPMIPTVPYDYSDFVLQWRVTACMMGECVKGREKEAFAIHGLLPQRLVKNGEESEEVTNCGGDRFDASQIPPELKPLWPSMYDNKYDELWKGEWDTHGTCFDSGTYYVSDYFNAAINLAGAYDIVAYLNAGGIILGQPYTVDAITKGIQRGSKNKIPEKAIQILCVTDPKSKELVVYKIYLCLNKAGKAPVGCPTKREMCSGKPMIPKKRKIVAPVDDSAFDEL